MPPIATTGTADRTADGAAGRRARSPAPRRPSTASPRPGRRRGSRPPPRAPAPGLATDRPSSSPRAAASSAPSVALPEMHAVRAERERGGDVVVHDERHSELREAVAALDDVGRRGLHAQLHDRRPGRDRSPRRLEVADERVHSHAVITRALASSVPGVERGERVVERDVERAGAVRPPRRVLAGHAERDRAPRRPRAAVGRSTARKQPVIADDMQPVPVIGASSGWPFATATTRSPSETWSTGPVTDATSPSWARRLRASSAGVAAALDRLDAAHLGLDADERRHLAGVARAARSRRPRRGSASRSRCGRWSRRRRPGRARPACRARSRRGRRRASRRPSAARACRC